MQWGPEVFSNDMHHELLEKDPENEAKECTPSILRP